MRNKPKFKVGDVVECINCGKSYGGFGWKLGHQFKIISVEELKPRNLYWRSFNRGGVYEDSLKLARKDEIIYM